MPDNRDMAALQKLADVTDVADPAFEFVARNILGIRPATNPRVWEYVMAYRALECADMLRVDRRGIAFGAGREPLTYAVPMRAGFLSVTDLYTGTTEWETARTHDPREFVLAGAPAGFDQSRIEVRSMDMRQIEYADHSLDFAYSISSLEHIGFDDDFIRHLREVRRVLKPDGVYVLTTEMRIRGESFRVEGNHCFDFDHLFSLFREAGLCVPPQFDARLADRVENEGRELLDTRFHDASNGITELLMVREFGGITSVPALFLLRPGSFQDVTITGLAETAAWLQQKLDMRINNSSSDWATLNPYGLLIGALSPYSDLWRDGGVPKNDIVFGTAYKNFGSAEIEIRVTIVTSPEVSSNGVLLVCVNAMSTNDVSDISVPQFEIVEIASDKLLAKRLLFRFEAVPDRCYSVFGTRVQGEIWVSDVVVGARRARGNSSTAPADQLPRAKTRRTSVDRLWRRLALKAAQRLYLAATQ